MHLNVGEVARITGGEVVAGSPDTVVTSFTNDSREVVPGACFLALRDHRDGHDFVRDAFRAGAAAALVERVPDGVRGGAHALVRVPGVVAALAALGRDARDRLPSATVVGITGSAGKTSTKDLTVAALSRTLAAHANVASFNNEIGLPMTLLHAPATTEVLVTEMGARFAGNIRDLCDIARPTVGVITHVGLAHAEHLGGPEGVAAVKGELLEALPASGLAVLNADDPSTPELAARSVAGILYVGLGASSEGDVRVRDVELDDGLRARFHLESPWGSGSIRLGVRGEHQVVNAAMGAAVALSLGVPFDELATGLESATASGGRLQLDRAESGLVVLDDTYNASPTSMAAALRSLVRVPVAGARIAVLGEMRELGPHAVVEHTAIGRLAVELGVDCVIAVGGTEAMAALAGAVVSAGGRCERVPEAGAVGPVLAAQMGPADAVLVKASRAVRLEPVAEGLRTGAIGVRA
ncbi:MAG: UDP-N-acetylmuramoyl-tripeptide--D-alanyl-D-alanine ligase [Acidimicrobiia bacterium]